MPHGVWAKKTLFQLGIMGSAFGGAVVNVLHFEAAQTLEQTLTSDAAALTAADDLIDSWQATAQVTWLALHGPEYQIGMYRAQVLERPTLFEHRLTPIERSVSLQGSGGLPGTAEDPQASMVVRWRSLLAGKSFRGRTYIGPTPVQWISDGRLTGTGTTAVNAWITAMMGEYGAAGTPPEPYALTVYSRPYNQGEYGYPVGEHPNREFHYPPDYAGNSSNVISGAVDPVIRVQRRRQVGVGA